MEEHQEDDAEGGSGGFQVEQIKSYLSFARRALRARWGRALIVGLVGFGLTIAAAVFLPRTYLCQTVIMALGSPLDRNDTPNPLAGAEGLIMRHENLEAIIRETGLVRGFEERRPPLLKLKDRIFVALFGKPTEAIKIASLVGTLENKLFVTVEKGQLTIVASWSDGPTAAQLAEAARESFLRARHAAEISAFEDRMAILDDHATKLRDEVGALADQLNAATQDSATPAQNAAPKSPTAAAAPAARRPRSAALDPNLLLTEDLGELKEKLAIDKPKLAQAENDWNRKLQDEQSKLAELKLKLMPSHPDVVTSEQRVALLSQVPSEVALLRAEVATLEKDIRGREGLLRQGSGPGALIGGPGGNDQLPTAVIQALTKDDTDPALRAQLSGAIMKYRDLRNDIRSGGIDLDTAQAAFNHRYQLVVPAETPSKPSKPKPALIIGGGFAASLLLALLLPILGELRRGIIVETWQVQHLQLPVLAELQLPPHTE